MQSEQSYALNAFEAQATHACEKIPAESNNVAHIEKIQGLDTSEFLIH